MEYVDIFVVDLTINVKAFERRLCGSTLPQPYISVFPQIEIVFGIRNKHKIRKRGFTGSFEFVEESESEFAISWDASRLPGLLFFFLIL